MTSLRRAGLLLATLTIVLGGALRSAQSQAVTTPAHEPLAAVTPAAVAAPDNSRVDVTQVKIERFVLASDVKAREPVGEGVSFPAGAERIYAFVQLDNSLGAPFAFTVSWEKVDGPVAKHGVELAVPTAKQFRTWSWTRTLKKPGKYRAVLRTLTGVELAARELTIEG